MNCKNLELSTSCSEEGELTNGLGYLNKEAGDLMLFYTLMSL